MWKNKSKEEIAEYNRQYRLKNREKLLAKQREYKSGIRKELAQKSREYYANKIKNNKAIRRDKYLKHNYGIGQGDYKRMWFEQGGCCACCKRNQIEFKQPLDVDHNHTTGQIRGLLCNRCNTGIGNFREDATALRQAADYLDKWNTIVKN